MPRRNRGNKSGRSRSNRGGVQPVISLSLSEAEERKLSVRSDRTSLRGKQVFSVTNGSGVSGASGLSVSNFGFRLGGLLGYYLRWRIVKLVIKPIYAPPGSGTLVYGVSDDPNDVTTGLSLNEVLELRTSRLVSSSGTDSSELQWNPVDPTKWYYTISEGAAGDVRLTTPCSLQSLNGTPGTIQYVIYYTIEAEGAFDNSS